MYKITIIARRRNLPDKVVAVEYNEDKEQGLKNARLRYGERNKFEVEKVDRG